VNRKWKLVLTFIAGCVFGELSSDFTDWIYFTYYRSVTAETAPIVWYWLTASWYIVLFLIAYLVAKTRLVTAESFVYFMMFMAVLGGYLSWNALAQQDPWPYLMFVLGIPTMVSLGLLWGLKRSVD